MSPRLPELSFTQENLPNSHLQISESFNDPPPASRAPFSPTNTHAEQLPPEPIDSTNNNSSILRNKQSNKKSNPLVDLVQTEEAYVTMLSVIIRKVAGAWTKTNLPPKELDAMFRAIEVVYKANKRLLSQLKEIDQNPSNPNSPKALGDLLMNWIIDLGKPYTNFANSYMTGFKADSWAPIASNTALTTILQTLNVDYPPDSFSPSPMPSWSLNSLFTLPRLRLKYYRKLYTRLLKSTEIGRSDHNLLVQAIQKLDIILDVIAQRVDITVGDEDTQNLTSLRSASLNETKIDGAIEIWARDKDSAPAPRNETRIDTSMENQLLQRTNLHPLDESSSGLHTPDRSLMFSANSIQSITDLEQKLFTNNVLDLFTLKPRPVQLQLNSSSLPFTRTIRLSKDVEIYFTPKALPQDAQVHPRGCLFLLTDLLLLCERMSFETSDINLLYPPLAAKHIRVAEPPSDVVLQITVLKKETITLRLKTLIDRDHLLKHLNKCVEDASALTIRRNQSPPPPVPPLKPLTNDTSIPNKALSTPGNVLHESRSISLQAVGDVHIGRLSLSHTVNHFQAPSEESNTNTSSFYDRPVLTIYPKRASVSQPPQLPVLQTDFTPTQRSASHNHNLYIPPPRGASNTTYSNLQPSGASHSHLNPALSHFHSNTILRGRSHYPNQQPGQSGGGGYLSNDNHMLRKSVSTTFLNDSYTHPARAPSLRADHPPEMYASVNRPDVPPLPHRQSRDSFASYPPQSRSNSMAINSWRSSGDNVDNSPAGSPVDDSHRFSQPIVSNIAAQFKCKVFLKLQHGQWKSLGSAKLKLYLQQPTNVKQLVAESESKDKPVFISTIVLMDGVERVGKTGVAIELSDKGVRTGIVYLVQLRNEASAAGLFDSLLVGSDRAASRTG